MIFRIGIGAGVAGLVAVVGLLSAVIALWYDSRQLAAQMNDSVISLRGNYMEMKEEAQRDRNSLAQKIEALELHTQDLQSSVGSALPIPIQTQLDDLRAEVENFRAELPAADLRSSCNGCAIKEARSAHRDL